MWEDILPRAVGWSDLWQMPRARLSFLIRAMYDILPSPTNLARWYSSEEKCDLCNTASGNLPYILCGCRTALAQSQYRWWQDQVLSKLAEHREYESYGQWKTKIPAEGADGNLLRVAIRGKHQSWPLDMPGRWQQILAGSYSFPIIAITTLRPNIVLWSEAERRVLLVELSPMRTGHREGIWEEKICYANLVAECQETGWRAATYQMEVGCRVLQTAQSFSSWATLALQQEKARTSWKNLLKKQKREVLGSGWKGKTRTGETRRPCSTHLIIKYQLQENVPDRCPTILKCFGDWRGETPVKDDS